MDTLIVAAILIVVITLGYYYYMGSDEEEGFTDELTKGSYVSRFFPRRGDVGEFGEEVGFQRDDRYFADYADIQRLGTANDFCRMVEPEGSKDPKQAFFACALAATENLSGTSFRTESVGEGLKRSRDDYMNDTAKSGRQDYCRILKQGDGSFQPMCRRALDTRFAKKDTVDPSPPPQITTLLNFYDGIIMWLRLRDDMVDYAQNLLVQKAGGITVPEKPLKPTETTEGLAFNGVDQFLRLGENRSLEFGGGAGAIALRSMRAVSFWVYFDEFTNNAHIFDFGSGAGKDNVFLGIVGRGNPTVSTSSVRDLLCGDNDTLPKGPSGQQPVYSDGFAAIPSGCLETAEGGSTAKGFTDGAKLVRPQKLMQDSAANCDEYTCPAPEIVGRRMAPLQPRALAQGSPISADLIYEVWDAQQRKMQIKASNAVKLKTWHFVVITATNNDAFRPDLSIRVDGAELVKKPGGFLPQSDFTTHNYIGKSNWSSATSQYENRDELFKGRLFDFRTYQTPMSFEKQQASMKWGAANLGIPVPGSPKKGRQSKYMQDVIPVNELSNFESIDKQRYTIGDTESEITILK
jgi:hypothetical protein